MYKFDLDFLALFNKRSFNLTEMDINLMNSRENGVFKVERHEFPTRKVKGLPTGFFVRVPYSKI